MVKTTSFWAVMDKKLTEGKLNWGRLRVKGLKWHNANIDD